MANQAQQLSLEISKLQNELVEKQKQLMQMQKSEIEKLVQKFAEEVEKSGFSKVEVKKLVVEKLTRKNKKTR